MTRIGQSIGSVSSSGGVTSVNGDTGVVVLNQDDIGDGTTYKQYSQTEKTKLAGIADGAEVNVNADWNSVSGDSQILNKPSIPTQYTDELAQDAVGGMIADTTTIDLTYTDATPELKADVKSASITNSLLANMAQSTIKGRKTLSTGSPEDLSASDVRTLINVADGANVGVVPNVAIVGATKTKITYDSKGLVTAGADATTADIADSTNKRYITDAQQSALHSAVTITDTNSIDLSLTGQALTADIKKQNSTSVDLSIDASGLKADLNATLKSGYDSAVTASHTRSHAITSTSDHTSTATSGQILKADANGLPVNATNTDAQVSATVTASHARSHAITSTSDHTSSATSGQMLKADANGLPVNATNTDAQVSSTVTASHTRSHALDSTSDHSIGGLTNTYLVKSDGTKLVPATNTDAQVAGAVTNSHVAVTVSDTASVDLGLTGQAITATVLPAGVDHNSLANLNTGNGTTHLPANGATTQLLQYASAGTAKWITVSGDASIADGGVLAVNKTRLNVRNETGTTIASTKAVYVSGFNNVPLISLANNTVETQHNVVGITIAPIADQANGFIATTGQCDAETNAWTVGTELFLSTSGALTSTAPTSGTVRHVAIVTVQQNYPAGKLLLYNFPEENYFAGGAGTDNIIRMGDSAGTNKTSFRDYVNNEVASINSDGFGVFANPLVYPAKDVILNHADGDNFNQNSATTPTGWTEVDAGSANNTSVKLGYWNLNTTSVNTAFKYRKRMSAITEGSYYGISFNDILFRDGAYTADVDYWFGIYGDNGSGTIVEGMYNRVNLHWNSTIDIWQVRHELNDNAGTVYNGTYYNLSFPIVQPLFFRIVQKSNDNTAKRGYIGTNWDAQSHSLLQTKTLAYTMNTPWIQIESSRGTGVDAYSFIGSIDRTENA
jgi:hypothetical protein